MDQQELTRQQLLDMQQNLAHQRDDYWNLYQRAMGALQLVEHLLAQVPGSDPKPAASSFESPSVTPEELATMLSNGVIPADKLTPFPDREDD